MIARWWERVNADRRYVNARFREWYHEDPERSRRALRTVASLVGFGLVIGLLLGVWLGHLLADLGI